MLAKSKLNSVETLISQALVDMEIGHEEFITTLNEKDSYEMMKDNLKNKNGESYEIVRFNSGQKFKGLKLLNVFLKHIKWKHIV